MEVIRVYPGDAMWRALIVYSDNCSWVAGKHLAGMLRENRFSDWEAAFAAVSDGEIIGFCTFLKTDYYPENRYSPWISCLFVDENHRGRRVSQAMIRFAEGYAKSCGFTKAYIPSDLSGFYEKYGYEKIDELVNYGGDTDSVYMKEL